MSTKKTSQPKRNDDKRKILDKYMGKLHEFNLLTGYVISMIATQKTLEILPEDVLKQVTGDQIAESLKKQLNENIAEKVAECECCEAVLNKIIAEMKNVKTN